MTWPQNKQCAGHRQSRRRHRQNNTTARDPQGSCPARTWHWGMCVEALQSPGLRDAPPDRQPAEGPRDRSYAKSLLGGDAPCALTKVSLQQSETQCQEGAGGRGTASPYLLCQEGTGQCELCTFIRGRDRSWGTPGQEGSVPGSVGKSLVRVKEKQQQHLILGDGPERLV